MSTMHHMLRAAAVLEMSALGWCHLVLVLFDGPPLLLLKRKLRSDPEVFVLPLGHLHIPMITLRSLARTLNKSLETSVTSTLASCLRGMR